MTRTLFYIIGRARRRRRRSRGGNEMKQLLHEEMKRSADVCYVFLFIDF